MLFRTHARADRAQILYTNRFECIAVHKTEFIQNGSFDCLFDVNVYVREKKKRV